MGIFRIFDAETEIGCLVVRLLYFITRESSLKSTWVNTYFLNSDPSISFSEIKIPIVLTGLTWLRSLLVHVVNIAQVGHRSRKEVGPSCSPNVAASNSICPGTADGAQVAKKKRYCITLKKRLQQEKRHLTSSGLGVMRLPLGNFYCFHSQPAGL